MQRINVQFIWKKFHKITKSLHFPPVLATISKTAPPIFFKLCKSVGHIAFYHSWKFHTSKRRIFWEKWQKPQKTTFWHFFQIRLRRFFLYSTHVLAVVSSMVLCNLQKKIRGKFWKKYQKPWNMAIFYGFTCATTTQKVESLPNQLFQMVRRVSNPLAEKKIEKSRKVSK